jgi:hypothetical protein
VRLGLLGDDVVEVLEGLAEGETVNDAPEVEEGAPVRVDGVTHASDGKGRRAHLLVQSQCAFFARDPCKRFSSWPACPRASR